jgi:hypothetical protein
MSFIESRQNVVQCCIVEKEVCKWMRIDMILSDYPPCSAMLVEGSKIGE